MINVDIGKLEATATRCRLNVLRMLRASGAGHAGGALSAIDMVVALYFHAMRHDPSDPRMKGRDRFILSAGHKCLAQYAVLAEANYFPKEVLDTYGQLGTLLPGHPDMHKLPGIEANTGALGHGLSISVGMALGLRADAAPAPDRAGDRAPRVYTILGDGELPEGSNWEAAAAAAHYGLDNVTAFVDAHGLQISGRTKDVMDMRPIAGKFASYGWAVTTIDGNDMGVIISTLDSLPLESGRPSCVIANTVKGKGISSLEGLVSSHYWKPKPEELDAAEAEMVASLKDTGEPA